MRNSDRSRPWGEIDLDTLTRWIFLAVWAISAANALHYLSRGWLPHDLGTLAQPAARVLRGQWPHRDFQDTYTGGLAVLGAFAFKVLGVNAMSLRWLLFAVYLSWVPAVWYLSRRMAGPVLAGVATLLAASWTLPMYAEGMPSWYNLFLATFGTAALFRWLEVPRRRWLFLAGLAGGLSIVVKIVGLYYVAGGLLFLAFATEVAPGAWSRSLVFGGALTLAALVAVLVVRAMGPEGLLRFGIPAAAPPLTLAAMTFRPRSGGTGEPGARSGWRPLAASTVPFLAGVATPVALLVFPYAATGSLDALLRGVFVLPARRFASASWTGLQGHGLGVVLAGAIVLAVAWAPSRKSVKGGLAMGVGALLAISALVSSGRVGVYRALWQALWWLPPWVAITPVALFLADRMPAARAKEAFALFSVYGLVTLVEVPFAAPIYFFYAAPLMVLLGLSLAGSGPPRRRAWLLSTLVCLLTFTALRLNPGFIRHLGLTPERDTQSQVLELPRAGGIRVDATDKEEYETIVRMIAKLAGGPYIYATPDCPEVYFLSGEWNPTPTLYEFLDARPPDPSHILDLLDRAGVRVVVVNRNPLFSPNVTSALAVALQKRYPRAREVGRFLVAWRTPADTTATPGPSSR